MNSVLFAELARQVDWDWKHPQKIGRRLNQLFPEWKTYLEFVDAVFRSRQVERPIVVEIGILDGMQKLFYETLFNAEYISIDINQQAPATIIGDSAHQTTKQRLLDMLNGRMIDLLFIDGLHTYEGVRADYYMYKDLVSHIIGIHDILTPKNSPKDTVDVIRFWEELKRENKTDTLITIQHDNPRPSESFNGRPLGIGIILKES